MNCSIITIGTELLIGQVLDTNSVWLGKSLADIGVQIVSKISVSDDRADLLKAFQRAEEDAELILITGGLGPTKDDITKQVLAEYFGVDLYFDEGQYERIKAFFQQLNRSITDAHRQQCYFPSNVELLENNMGTAAGMLFRHHNKRFISMPGVPYEMKYIMEHSVLPLLAQESEKSIVHKTILTAGVGETVLAKKIEDIEDQLPPHLSLAYLPGLGRVRVRISGASENEAALKKEIDDISDKIVDRFGHYVFGFDEDSLAKKVGRQLMDKGYMLGLAESCTGGSVAKLITSVPGSSKYFQGSVVSYSYDLKESLLQVQKDTLLNTGAVSEETVLEMVRGAIKLLNVDVAVSISGIAGPGGGTPDKPVGTVWLCVGDKDKQFTKKLSLSKDREKNVEYSSNAALNMLRLFLDEKLLDD